MMYFFVKKFKTVLTLIIQSLSMDALFRKVSTMNILTTMNHTKIKSTNKIIKTAMRLNGSTLLKWLYPLNTVRLEGSPVNGQLCAPKEPKQK